MSSHPIAPGSRARRVYSLVKKETRQIIRDPSSIAIGVVMPLFLILLFGYGLSLDVTNIPVAIVLEAPSPESRDLAAGFSLSRYFKPRYTTQYKEAVDWLTLREVDGIIRIRENFPRDLENGSGQVQVIVHGTDSNRARFIELYSQGAISQWSLRRAAEGDSIPVGPVVARDRMWFNEANESRHFIVPGLIVLIMTLIGALLTALVVAREWERGTFEALFVTPVTSTEILLGKTIPYFLLGMIGLLLCILAGKFLFGVPFRGSLWVLMGASMLYLVVALGVGLFISAATKNQFVASQVTLLTSFLPALMLSGFIYDIRSMPPAVQFVTYLVPARYYVALLQTIFLAGDNWNIILPNAGVLALMAAALLFAIRHVTRKRLD